METRSRRSRNRAFNARVVGNRGQCCGGWEHGGAAGAVEEVVAKGARVNAKGMRCWSAPIRYRSINTL